VAVKTAIEPVTVSANLFNVFDVKLLGCDSCLLVDGPAYFIGAANRHPLYGLIILLYDVPYPMQAAIALGVDVLKFL
jgi:hypothetical protein